MFDGIFQPTHLIIILVIALLVMGPKRLPEIGRSLGSGLRGFKDSLSDGDERRDDAEADRTRDDSTGRGPR